MGKYHLYLSEEERQLVLHALIDFRNKLIAAGRYTDAVDELKIAAATVSGSRRIG